MLLSLFVPAEGFGDPTEPDLPRTSSPPGKSRAAIGARPTGHGDRERGSRAVAGGAADSADARRPSAAPTGRCGPPPRHSFQARRGKSMPPVDEFKDPKTTLDFLSRNIVLPTEFRGDQHAQVKGFTLDPTKKTGYLSGQPIVVYRLVPFLGTEEPPIKAYWCPYKQNELHSVTVG